MPESKLNRYLITFIALLLIAKAARSAEPLKQGDSFSIAGQRHVLTRLDTLPYVESDYTKRFKFDSADNPGCAR